MRPGPDRALPLYPGGLLPSDLCAGKLQNREVLIVSVRQMEIRFYDCRIDIHLVYESRKRWETDL